MLKKYTREELTAVLKKHQLWLRNEIGGKKANLTGADLTGANLTRATLTGTDLTEADLTEANLTGADLTGANLTRATLAWANLTGTDLTGANLDYSCWPLRCSSLKAHVDDRIAAQLLYHALAVVKNSPNVSDELKDGLLTKENMAFSNRFHRAEECKVFKEEA